MSASSTDFNYPPASDAHSKRLSIPAQRLNGVSRFLEQLQWGALVALIPLVAIPYGASEPWWEAAFQCSVFVLGALWILNGMLNRSWPVGGRSMLWPLLVLSIYVCLQVTPWGRELGIGFGGASSLSADPIAGRHFLFALLALATFGLLLRQHTTSRLRLSRLLYVVIGVGILSAFFGLLRMILEKSGSDLTVLGLAPTDGFGQFFNRNHFAMMINMTLGLDLGLIVGGGVRRQQLPLHLGILMLLAITIIFTTSRGGIFTMMVLVLSLTALFIYRRSWMERRGVPLGSIWRRVGKAALTLVLLVFVTVALGVGVATLGGDPLESRLDKLPGELTEQADPRENSRRADVWQATLRLIQANKLTGVGFGAYQAAIPAYHDASGAAVPETAINGYLNLLAGGGLIGCALFAWFAISVGWTIRKEPRPKGSFLSAARIGALAGLFSVVSHSLVDSGLHVPINAMIFCALIVITTASVPDQQAGRSVSGYSAG
jgi:O-antigen ligase